MPAGLKPHEFTLTDQHGRRVSLSSFRGDVVILAFLYSTSKAAAPLIAQQIRGAVDELEPHTSAVRAVAVSVDPTADTPARVRAFLRASSLTGRLEYLTGNTAQLRAVWRAYHVVPASAGEGAYERGAFVLLLDKSRRRARRASRSKSSHRKGSHTTCASLRPHRRQRRTSDRRASSSRRECRRATA